MAGSIAPIFAVHTKVCVRERQFKVLIALHSTVHYAVHSPLTAAFIELSGSGGGGIPPPGREFADRPSLIVQRRALQ